VLTAREVLDLQDVVRRVPASESTVEFAVKLARHTRPNLNHAPDFVRRWVSWGAGPRASQALVLGAKARAALNGRFYATCADIREVALPVLRHRIITNFNAEAEGIRTEYIVRELAASIPVCASGLLARARSLARHQRRGRPAPGYYMATERTTSVVATWILRALAAASDEVSSVESSRTWISKRCRG
jgi:hypothetical protein